MTANSSAPNLFHYASRELHQDAVLAWLIDWSSPTRRKMDSQLQEAAQDVVQALFQCHPAFCNGELSDVLCVKTQWKSIDVFTRLSLTDGRTVSVVIENKTISTRHDGQLTRYRETAQKEFPHDEFIGLYVKTGWLQAADTVGIPTGYVTIDRPTLLGILRANPCRHAILTEYVRYLEDVETRYAQELSALKDPSRYSYALSHAHVQWHLFDRLFSTLADQSTAQYLGVNRNGTPWTQFYFKGVHLPGGREESLFWRIDQRKVRGKNQTVPYLAIRAYEVYPKDDSALRQEKLSRLESYRREFDLAVTQIKGLEIVPGRRLSDWTGNFESEVGVFLIDGDENTIPRLEKWVPLFHRKFLELIS